MIYLNEADIREIGIDWSACTDVISDAVKCLLENETAQPIKLYLRYKDLKNRIIAMPAYVGGSFGVAGLKWIASFPDNIKKGIPRASSAVILNDSVTGAILATINTNLLSVIRTVSVSSLLIRKYIATKNKKNITLGIIGFGPIGQYHLKMCSALYGERIGKIICYDLRNIAKKELGDFYGKVEIVDSWQKAYEESDIVITCTVSDKTYIDRKPKDGSLLLNVSLRDFKPEVFDHVKKSIIVDDWDEVCRESTDIEVFHKQKSLQKEQVKNIVDVVIGNCMNDYSNDLPIMFNPMGMSIFDMAIAKHYLDLAKEKNLGIELK